MLGPLPGSLLVLVAAAVAVVAVAEVLPVVAAVVRIPLARFEMVEPPPHSQAAKPRFALVSVQERLGVCSWAVLVVVVVVVVVVECKAVAVAAEVVEWPCGYQLPSCFGCLVARTVGNPG